MTSYPNRLKNTEYFIDGEFPYQIYRQSITGYNSLHWHEFFEINIVLSGEGINIVNGREYQISRGHVFLLTPTDFHEISNHNGTSLEIFNLIFTEGMLDKEIYELLFTSSEQFNYQFNEDEFDHLKYEFEKIYRESKQKEFGSERIVKGTIEYILILLKRESMQQTDQSNSKLTAKPYHAGIYRSLLYIQRCFREDLTLEDAAKEAGLVANYFSQCFKSYTGTSFQNYLLDLRLNFAKSMLKVSEQNITEVCHASGFKTLTHFQRMFKKKFGMSPREYKSRK